MNPYNLFRTFRHFLFIGIALSFLTTCNITGSVDSTKRFGGLLSFITSYTSVFDNALLELTGTLVAEDGVTPIPNGTLVINYQLLNVSSKAQMDSKVTTDSSGYFKMNLNVGKFTITVFSSSGENLGYFTLTITSSTDTPNVEKNGRFGVNNLAVKPITSTSTSTCSGGASLCGFITGASSSSGKFFVFGSSSEVNSSSNTPVVYETSDGITFTKNKVTLGSCVSSYSTSSNTECRITAVGYDGSTYFVMGVKSTCIANSSCTTSNTYAGKGSSLGSIIINEVTAPTIFSDSTQNYVYANGVFHYISSSSGTTIYSSSNGTSFTNFSISSTGTSPLQTSCQNLYIGESGYPFCGFKYYYNGTWTATTTSVGNSLSAATLSKFRGSYNKAFYQILTFDTSALTSGIYNTSGSLIPGGNFSSNSTLKFSVTGSLTPLYSTSSYMGGGLANITAGSSSTPPVLNSISIVRSSDNGATYTSSGITLPVTITYPIMGFGSTNSYMFLAGYVKESSTVTKSYLFRSADGITWTTVTLP